jgi:hypothetical protein
MAVTLDQLTGDAACTTGMSGAIYVQMQTAAASMGGIASSGKLKAFALAVASGISQTLYDALNGLSLDVFSASASALSGIDQAKVLAAEATSIATLASDAVAGAAADATLAKTTLDSYSSDNVLSPFEKAAVVSNAHDLIDGKAAIDTESALLVGSGAAYDATLAGLVSTYDSSITALTTYLLTLTTTSLPGGLVLGANEATWVTQPTTIVGATFRSKFGDAYTARQNLLASLSAKAKSVADGAKTVADLAAIDAAAAATDAGTANSLLAKYADDGWLMPGEKGGVLTEYHDLVDGRGSVAGATGILYQASQAGVSTTTYDAKITALVGYFAAQTWNLPGGLGMTWQGTGLSVGATQAAIETAWRGIPTQLPNPGSMSPGDYFRLFFSDAYAQRQLVLDQIAAHFNTGASAASGALMDAGRALALAGSKTKVFYTAAPPTDPGGDNALRAGDIWYSTTVSDGCPDADCAGHVYVSSDNQIPQTGVGVLHRSKYWAHEWTSVAWRDAKGQQMLIASEIAAGAIVADAIAANAITAGKIEANALVGKLIKTSNFAESGGGVSSGVIMDGTAVSDTTPPLRVSPAGLQIGRYKLSETSLYKTFLSSGQVFVSTSSNFDTPSTFGDTLGGAAFQDVGTYRTLRVYSAPLPAAAGISNTTNIWPTCTTQFWARAASTNYPAFAADIRMSGHGFDTSTNKAWVELWLYGTDGVSYPWNDGRWPKPTYFIFTIFIHTQINNNAGGFL